MRGFRGGVWGPCSVCFPSSECCLHRGRASSGGWCGKAGAAGLVPARRKQRSSACQLLEHVCVKSWDLYLALAFLRPCLYFLLCGGRSSSGVSMLACLAVRQGVLALHYRRTWALKPVGVRLHEMQRCMHVWVVQCKPGKTCGSL